jgi:hypothetical protein
MTIPKRHEINVFDSLDERTACDHFLGKNLAEAEALLSENPVYYQEDLMWMGPRAFRYYVAAAINLIKGTSAPDSDLLNCLAGTLEFRFQHEPHELVEIAPLLEAFGNHVVGHWHLYAVDVLYGDLRGRYAALAHAFDKLARSSNA